MSQPAALRAACAQAGTTLLAAHASSSSVALEQWIDLFVDFVSTKHGLAEALQSDSSAFAVLHDYFVDRLVPACAKLLDVASDLGQIRADIDAYELMCGIGNLCIGTGRNSKYDARRMVSLVVTGLQVN